MVISANLIRDYQETYKRKFHKDVSAKDAERELFDLSKLIKLITKERKKRNAQ